MKLDRSATMRAVKGKNTSAELVVRQLAHRLGYRYRLHGPNLPGKPDLVFPGRRKVIFVHGCFWHGHDCARGSRVPKTNRDYWQAKVLRNRERDRRNAKALNDAGWDVAEFWECELRDQPAIERKLTCFLGERPSHGRNDVIDHLTA